jgi:phosphatidate cytidylyltransferase
MNSTAVNGATGQGLDKLLKSNLVIRIISAAVLVPVFYFIVKTGNIVYGSLLLLGVLWAGYEWLAMLNPQQQKRVWITTLFSLALTWGVALQADYETALLVCLCISLCFMVGFRIGKVARPVLLSMGISYLGSAMLGLMALRDLPNGFSLTAFLCASVWMTDTGAYFFGKFLRGARLAPDISPAKTWSGFCGGLIVAMLTSLVCIWLFSPAKPVIVVIAALGLSLASQCGDLFESWIKRQAGVKNSSDLIPGHGGLLDRVDGLLMATVLFWIVLWATGFDLSWWVI